jgi:hypothetical protein
MKPNHAEIGVGATEHLNLRVSVATLVRVLFEPPSRGDLMLALERKATVIETASGPVVEVRSQPFGGAVHIRDLGMLRDSIGGFNFDSEHSRSEGDFRILIQASDWPAVREFCVGHLRDDRDPVLETGPERELAEEFAGALKVSLKPGQYVYKPVAIVVEDHPVPTGNIRARGTLTARVYRIFEAHILDSSLAHAMLMKSEHSSDQDLVELALEDARHGGHGLANAVLALPLERLSAVYLAMSASERSAPILFEQNELDETVPAVLDGISVPKYRRL